MYRIVYVSQAVRPMTEGDLEDVLARARETNERTGVTGLLVYAHPSFLQVLEGDVEAVETAYAAAAASTRHTDLRRTTAHVPGGRRFDQWSMGFRHAAPGDVVEALLAPLVEEGQITAAEVASLLLARFSQLAGSATA